MILTADNLAPVKEGINLVALASKGSFCLQYEEQGITNNVYLSIFISDAMSPPREFTVKG